MQRVRGPATVRSMSRVVHNDEIGFGFGLWDYSEKKCYGKPTVRYRISSMLDVEMDTGTSFYCIWYNCTVLVL